MAMPNQPRHLGPFRDACAKYRKAHWYGTLPLPAKQKHPPPTGFTGHDKPYPSADQLKEWLNDPQHRRANIGIRLAGVDEDWEIIGADVDHYVKGGKDKRGGDQLKDIENSLGPLPDTWTSSAQGDGVSGIRYYRVPRGLAFRGQIAKDIECIQKGHRFAVVWPSIHPDGGMYWWYPPGVAPSKENQGKWDGTLPDAKELPFLPDPWIDFLTRGRMRADKVEIDMDSSKDEIYAWAYEKLGEDEPMCYRMREKMEKHIRLIEEEATSHDKIVNAHMNVFYLALEGHKGWDSACQQIEKAFVKVCEERDKRGVEELRMEIFRSRTNGLRKVKAKADANLAIGAVDVVKDDPECADNDDQGIPVIGGAPPTDNLGDIPKGSVKPTPEYRTNDDGNADHFVDTWSNNELGPAFRFIKGKGWLIWHTGDGGARQPHWETDPDGKHTMREMWKRVRDRQEQYAEACRQDYITKRNAVQNQQPGTSAADRDMALKLYNKWAKFAENSGNTLPSERAINATKGIGRVCELTLEDLDNKPNLIGVANGVVELNPDGPRLRRAEPEDFVTLNTNTPWLSDQELSAIGSKLWNEYLDKFLPDKALRRDLQIILGHALIGGNPHKKLIVLKGAANTGKSVMISMVNEVLGEYAKTTNRSLFTYHKLNPVLAAALPMRVVSIIELSHDAKNPLTVDQMKTATGNDFIEAELKGSNATVNRVPFFLPIMVTNTVPAVEGHDKALRERLRVVPFDVVEENPDDTIAARMRTESKTAVMAWLFEGYRMYCENGRRFPENERMNIATDEFASEMDFVSQFVSDNVVKHSHMGNMGIRWQDSPEWCVNNATMYGRYQQWFDDMEFRARDHLSQPAFTRRLRELGLVCKQTRPTKLPSARYWLGVKLTSTGRPTGGTAGIGIVDPMNLGK